MKAATMESAVSGFRCIGIVPFNCNILPASEFLVDPRESPIVTANSDLSINETESVDTGTTITTLILNRFLSFVKTLPQMIPFLAIFYVIFHPLSKYQSIGCDQ